jgi:membrane-bound lytic murein transglycosylase D
MLALLLLLSFAGSSIAPASVLDKDSDSHRDILTVTPRSNFGVDARMQKNLDFWVSIYSKYYTYQGLIHDAKYVDHVYEVLDLRGKRESRVTRDAKAKWRDILMSVHHKQNHPEKMNAQEKRIYEMYADVSEPDKFLAAAHRRRLRFQLGQKDRFLEGYIQSGRYLPRMEEIFRREGLPVELTRLPFVESSFNTKAKSKVGASGIWQFMRSTGKLFLKINDAVDERNDPIRATEAAAKLLRMNYESLRSWPLAVTAYNHGRKGMMRAVRKVGSDELEDLVGSYHARSFGFASSNFFTELLAAIETERNAQQYFGNVERAKPKEYIEAEIPEAVNLKELAGILHMDVLKLKDLNPGVFDAVFKGKTMLPATYRLRIPYDGGVSKDAALRIFLAGFNQIPSLYKQRGRRHAKYGNR